MPEDIVPVQVLDILKEYLLVKMFTVTLTYVLLMILFKLSIDRNRNWAKRLEIDLIMYPNISFFEKIC